MQTILISGILIGCFVFHVVESDLVLVHAIFRHGERSADTFLMYPNDPYRNESFYPYGNGQMTNIGKRTMYELGTILRNRYSHFLGDVYLPEYLDAWASHLPRTHVALQLVLASLFPPKGPQIWEETLKWQPISYNFLPKKDDTLLLSILLDNYKNKYYKYCETNEGKSIIEKVRSELSYIQKHTGWSATTPRDFLFLFITLSTEDHFGLSLPHWTKKIYPQPLTDLIRLEFKMELATKELKKLLLGTIMNKILTDTENRIQSKSKQKLHLYSAHDVNIIYCLTFLGIEYKNHPGYGACLALEIHEEGGKYFLEVHYKGDKHSNFELLQFGNGEKRMYLDQFREMVNELMEEKKIYSTQSGAAMIFEKQMTYFQVFLALIYYNYIQ